MPQALKVGVKQLVEEAKKEIEEVEVGEAIGLVDDESVLIVDIRDVRELKRDGKIPGSFHCPRGMLEFWIDPESPYFKPVFGEGKRVLFHCAADWRSALATQTAQRMGLAPVGHIKGGLKGWKEAGGPIEMPE
ncbi:MAG: rhodanese-like domain-containing protein [Hyphomicrobiales bacterium]|nr:rhodanese-like domain-containing protein [Hyphomicrobiales bacterium]